MKLISLNTWGGKIYQPLIDFIKSNFTDTDIFCFQEVFNTTTDKTEDSGFRLNLYSEIEKILTNHQGYYVPTQDKYIFYKGFVDFDLSYGLAIFVKTDIKIIKHSDLFIFGKRNSLDPADIPHTLPKNLQYLTFTTKGKQITVCNYHGIWLPVPNSKSDTQSRINQSKKINQFLKQIKGEKILCGDLNLALNTQSIKILEENMLNLIKKYKINTTRNKYFPGDDKFADYTFVSSGINAKSFQVPEVEISDHLPMLLEFS